MARIEIPFKTVYIHGLVRDAERQKMSKTKGNVIDPLVLNEKYGTDAVRFALIGSAAPGADIALSEQRIDAVRAFANKVWNASRLIFSRIDVTQPAPAESPMPESLEDRWIRSRLNACAAAANRALEQHRYNDAANELWHFYWDEFCDWYLELKKPRFEENTAHLIDVYETALRLLHPLMPFLTEELWQRLQRPGKSIALQPYPRFDPAAEDKNAEHDMAHLQAIVTAARGLKAEHGIDGRQTLPGILYAPGHAYHVAQAHAASIRDLAKVELELRHEGASKLEGAVRSTPDFDLVLEVRNAKSAAGGCFCAGRCDAVNTHRARGTSHHRGCWWREHSCDAAGARTRLPPRMTTRTTTTIRERCMASLLSHRSAGAADRETVRSPMPGDAAASPEDPSRPTPHRARRRRGLGR
jgi:valyl-tRNA synthetase